MRLWNMFANDSERGRASLEFLTAGILLLIPIMFLGMSLSSVQNAALATETAAKNGARAFTNETSMDLATARSMVAVQLALSNHGIDQVLVLERSCVPSSCLAPGSLVSIRVGVSAPLFSSSFLPGFLGRASVPVFATASSMVSIYGGAP
jgi:hypothetical protein